MKKETLPKVLAYEKKLVPSNGIMFATKWNERGEEKIPLSIISKSVKGTISNRIPNASAEDPAKIKNKIESANLQIVDSCTLPIGYDTLHLFFTLKVLGNIDTPSSCNNALFKERYIKLVQTFREGDNFKELGLRYAINLANGRFLWRNRVGSNKIEVRVKSVEENKEWIFNSLDFSLKNFETENQDIIELGEIIAKVLSSKEDFLNLQIDAFVQMGEAQEVYPSEELVMNKNSKDKKDKKDKEDKKFKKKKILFSIDNIAGMHSQKIGNAIRTIDTWFPEYADTNYPISIETYGTVTSLEKAYRHPSNKLDFYSIFDKATSTLEFKNSDEANYVMAMIIRGGVFGDSKK